MNRISTGSKNLDIILSGGVPSDSITLIAGPAGSGKSVLAHQIFFSNLKEGFRGVYLTTLGEPVYKVIKNMQSFEFFDPIMAAHSIDYEDTGFLLSKEGLKKFNDFVSYTLLNYSPSFYCIDGIDRLKYLSGDIPEFESFLYDLTGLFSAYHCTTFWLGTFTEAQIPLSHEANSCDNLIYLSMDEQGGRSLKVLKLGRSSFISGENRCTINEQGIRVTPKLFSTVRPKRSDEKEPFLWKVEPFQEFVKNAGLSKGAAILIQGEPGTGKTTAGLRFIADGIEQGEKGGIVSFKEDLSDLSGLSQFVNYDLESRVEKGEASFWFQSPTDMNLDELALRIMQMARQTGTGRLFINDLHFLFRCYSGSPSEAMRYIYSLFQVFKLARLTVLFSYGNSPYNDVLQELCDLVLVSSRKEEDYQFNALKGVKHGRFVGKMPSV
jgi:circadian clock protein KaiC